MASKELWRKKDKTPRGGGQAGRHSDFAQSLQKSGVQTPQAKRKPHEGNGLSNVPAELYPLCELPKRAWMPRKNGKSISMFTALRWALHGHNGTLLKSLMVGGTRCTSDPWAMDFFEACTVNRDKPQQNFQGDPKDHAAAEAEFDAAGITTQKGGSSH